MSLSLICALLLTAELGALAQDKHFMGGSLTFKFIDASKPNAHQVELTVVTGWVLGEGPCGEHCSTKDLGRSTITSRKIMTDLYGDAYFGNWTSETNYLHGNISFRTITDKVSKGLVTEEILSVNVPLRWEQEVAEVVLEVDPAAQYTDLVMRGISWKTYDYNYRGDGMFHLQTKINAHERNDTMQANNSPVVMFKPLYKVLLNNLTVIKLATLDQDGDYVQCQQAKYRNAGGVHPPNNVTINKDCSIEIKAYESDHFFDGGFGAIAVQINDYNSNPIIRKGERYPYLLNGPYRQELSQVVVQFMIQTLKIIEAPEFVAPTKSSQHVFYVYVGSTLEIPLYAKPYKSPSSKVDFFNLRSIPRQPFVIPPLKSDTNRTRDDVKYTIVKWRPQKPDVGSYVIGALVTDDKGNDGSDRNYNIIVKDINVTTPDVVPANRPYFPLFPDGEGIQCLQNSTCSFPIYAATERSGGRIASLKYTASNLKEIHVAPPIPITIHGLDMFVSDVSLTSSQIGRWDLCFRALDDRGAQSEERCLRISMEVTDPCNSTPCNHRGSCESNGTSFNCNCFPGITGPLCETAIDECQSNPCQHNATCLNTMPRFYFCVCLAGFTGKNCETTIDGCQNKPCQHNATCFSAGNPMLPGTYVCMCSMGFTGINCDQSMLIEI
ncbi:uncharacterized protein LOC124134797 [Haliotis rufescens]|uniref:uncharacterized protein LOC124134797 n=1 Tax=Haliotis rufescens TaxID=6454 RepID=UPI00201F7AE9|nr:uncharacterized protein LOC124134797 [Haliotis rufescens]